MCSGWSFPEARLQYNHTLSCIWQKHIFRQNLLSLEGSWCCRESCFSPQRAKAASRVSFRHTAPVSAGRRYKTRSIQGLFAETLRMTHLRAITSFPREKLHGARQITKALPRHRALQLKHVPGLRHQQGRRNNILHRFALRCLPDPLQRALRQS